MWLSISEKVVSNLRLTDGSLRELRLPQPPKTDFTYPQLLPSIALFLYRQTLSIHVKPNEIGSEADHTYGAAWEFQDNWKNNGLKHDQK